MQLIDACAASLALALACGLAAAQRHDEAARHEARRCAWQLAQLGAGALRRAEAEQARLAGQDSPCLRLDARDLRRQGELAFDLPDVNSYGQALEAHACLKEGRPYGIALAKGLPRPPRGAQAAGQHGLEVQRRLYRSMSLPMAQALEHGFALPPAGPGQDQPAGGRAGAEQGAELLADFGLPDPGPGSVAAVLSSARAGGDADYLRRVRTPGLEDRSSMAAPLSLQGHAAAGASSLQLLPLQQERLVQGGRRISDAAAFAEACQASPAGASGSLASLDGRLAFAWTSPDADAGVPDDPEGALLACLGARPRTLAATPRLFQPREARHVLQGEAVPKPWCPRGSHPRLDLLPAASGSTLGQAPDTHALTILQAGEDVSPGAPAGGLAVSVTPAVEDARIEGFRTLAEDAGSHWLVHVERRRTVSAKSLANWEPLAAWRGVLCQHCLVRDAEWEEAPGASVLAVASCVPGSQAAEAAQSAQAQPPSRTSGAGNVPAGTAAAPRRLLARADGARP